MSLRASTSVHQSLAVDTDAELGKLTTTSLEDGDLVYVKGTGQYWRLSKSSTATVSGNVKACASGGRWFLCFIDSAGGAFSVPNIAALAAVDTVGMVDGAQIYVESVRSVFTLSSTAGTPDNITIVDAYGSSKYWYRDVQRSLTWEYQTTWYIDSATGDDENSGATSLLPLATWAEFCRRVETVYVTMTVNVVAATGQSLIGTFKPGNTTATLTVQGVPTVLASGATSTFVNPVPASNTRGTVTVTEINFATYVGKIARIQASDALLPILTNAGAVGRGGYWVDGLANTLPTNGATVEVLDLVAVTTVQIFSNGLPVQAKYLSCTSTTFQDLPVLNWGSAKIPSSYYGWYGCAFAYGVMVTCINTYLGGCLGSGSSLAIVTDGNQAAFIGGGSLGGVSINSGVAYFQGFQIESTGAPLLLTGQSSMASDSTSAPLGVYSSTAQRTGVYVQQNAFFKSGGATYGAVTNYGMIAIDGGRILIPSGTPTVTGTSGDFLIQGANSVVAPPTAGGVWAAAVDLSGTGGVGWGKWVAGGKKFVNYGTLAAITST